MAFALLVEEFCKRGAQQQWQRMWLMGLDDGSKGWDRAEVLLKPANSAKQLRGVRGGHFTGTARPTDVPEAGPVDDVKLTNMRNTESTLSYLGRQDMVQVRAVAVGSSQGLAATFEWAQPASKLSFR